MKGFTLLFSESWHGTAVAWSVYRSRDVFGKALARGESPDHEQALAAALVACRGLPQPTDDADVLAALGEPVTESSEKPTEAVR